MFVARLVAERSPDRRGPAGPEAVPVLPEGGRLYEIRVERVPWTFDRPRWDALRKSASVHVEHIVEAAGKGDFAAAAAAADAYRRALLEELAPYGALTSAYSAAWGLQRRLEAELGPGSRRAPLDPVFARAAACDRIWDGSTFTFDPNPCVAYAYEAFEECAERGYEDVLARPSHPDLARTAGLRLAELLFDRALVVEPGARRSLSDRAAALRRRFDAPGLSDEGGEPPPR